MSAQGNRSGYYDSVDLKSFYEVVDPRTTRIRLETLSLDEAKTFVRTAWDKTGEVLEINHVERERAV